LQRTAVKKIIEVFQREGKEISSKEIYDKKYLDIESLYKKHGWVVVYDKPGYSETYDPYWTFTKKK
jgi:gamma-glutamylcysteine synthetase